MATQFDVIVIGAGIVGASAAYYLAKTGNRVAAPLAIEMRKLVAWGAPAYRQRPGGRVNITVSEDGFHDLMLNSFIYG